MTDVLQTQVLIIGGGPVGLTLAGLLAQQNIQTIVVERRTETVRAPAAHVLRNRARAVLALLGVDDSIDQKAPVLDMRYITWCTTLRGPEIGRLDIGSPENGFRPWTNISQNLLEPILLEGIKSLPSLRILTGATCHSLTQTEANATATLTDSAGNETTINADWVVAADGAGSRTRKALGIEMVGNGPLGQFFMVHFKADLTPWVSHRPSPIFWINHPQASGTLIIHDLESTHVFMTPVNGLDDEAAGIPARLAAALNIPIEVEIISVDSWVAYCQVAERYREGRVFLLGDAAHRFPPSGGLGLNTGILEAHNLAGKLMDVIAYGAETSILDSYEAECRPIAQTNAQESLMNGMRLGLIYGAIGGVGDLEALENRLVSMSAAERVVLADAIEQQRSHFSWDGAFPVSARDLIPEAATA
jgi:2,4-dichlorophenol 6-monooxygenase